MTDGFLALILHFPKIIYSIILTVVIGLTSQLPSMQIDTVPENMLSSNDPFRRYHNEVKQQFSLYDSMQLGIVNKDGIYNPRSLQIITQITDNEYAPTTQQQADEIASAIARLPLLTNTMVSEDHQAIAIYIPLVSKTVSYQLAEEIRVYVAQFDGDHQFYITGLPVAEDQFGSEMFVQIAICAPLAGAMIFFMMWLFFRNIPLIVAPMLVTIAVVDSIHIMSEFVDRYQRYKTDAASAIKQVVAHLFQPMFFTPITSAVGFSL